MNIRVIKFFFEEALSSLKNNLLMTIISIITITITLTMLAFFLLLFVNLNHVIGSISRNLQVVAYLEKNVTLTGVSRVKSQVSSIAGIKTVKFYSKDTAWDALKQRFKYQQDIVSLFPANPLPDSLIINLTSIEDLDRIVSELKLVQGIESVKSGKRVAERVRKIVQFFNYGGLGIVIFLLLATFFIITNTINLTVIAKGKEVEIMKLVGAHNSFIKWAFILEGLIIGFIGSTIAVSFVNLVYNLFIIKIQESVPFLPVFLRGMSFISLNAFLVIIGLFIGTSGSFLSIKKLLKSNKTV